MGLDPESFRGMAPNEMLLSLLIDAEKTRHEHAMTLGAKCISCFDSGLNNGSFCGCAAGAKLAYQTNKKE